jgi:hypothetical protein
MRVVHILILVVADWSGVPVKHELALPFMFAHDCAWLHAWIVLQAICLCDARPDGGGCHKHGGETLSHSGVHTASSYLLTVLGEGSAFPTAGSVNAEHMRPSSCCTLHLIKAKSCTALTCAGYLHTPSVQAAGCTTPQLCGGLQGGRAPR